VARRWASAQSARVHTRLEIPETDLFRKGLVAAVGKVGVKRQVPEPSDRRPTRFRPMNVGVTTCVLCNGVLQIDPRAPRFLKLPEQWRGHD
jgi:hypothetical protein